LWNAFIQWFIDVINLAYGLTVHVGLPSYGIAIILMTIAIKVVMFPLTQRQMHSMSAMQEIQPKTKYIQDKYKDDPKVMQQKIMELYKENGVSPFGGCLPLLIQMPIFIAFYQSLFKMSKVEFLNAANPGFLWIANIGKPDPYYILAVLAAATTYYQQKISMVDSKDPTQKTMLYFMPIFMAFIAYKLPAGLPLYWVVFNILGILQQLYVNRQKKSMAISKGTALLTMETQENAKPSTAAKADNKSGNTEKSKEGKPSADGGNGNTTDAGRDKGGKAKNASPNSRKKGKKR
jgi:YidC/Oxa1 family membrane protein insertase